MIFYRFTKFQRWLTNTISLFFTPLIKHIILFYSPEEEARSAISELEEEHTKDNNKHKIEFESLLESRLAEEKTGAESRLQEQVRI